MQVRERIQAQIVVLAEQRSSAAKDADALRARFDERLTDLVENNRAASATVAKRLGDQLEQQVATLANSNRAAIGNSQTLFDSLGERIDSRIADLAEKQSR
jgi:ABC-type transporter MlaC component